MAITTNRLIELAITGDPTAALIGATWSFSGGDLLTEVDAAMDAGVTGTTGIMQPGDLIDLDGNGTYEGTYQGRFNYTGSTFHLGDGSTVSGTINIIEVTVGGTSQYYMMVNDSLAADLDGKNLSSVTFGSSSATSPNTDGFNFDDATSYELVCFARGTMIATDRGERPVEDLVAGDRVLTRDNGYQVIRWTGSRVVPARGRFAPVVFLADAVGNTKTMRLSQQHRVRLGGALVELNFGCSSVLAPAQALVNGLMSFARRVARSSISISFSTGMRSCKAMAPGPKAFCRRRARSAFRMRRRGMRSLICSPNSTMAMPPMATPRAPA